MTFTGAWFPLSNGQEALWFLARLVPDSWAYNIVLPVRIRGALDLRALRKTLQALSDRHPSFRTEFSEEGGAPRQRAIPRHAVRLMEIDASGWKEGELDRAVRAGKLDETGRDEAWARLTFSCDWGAMADRQLVVEAVTEDATAKLAVFRDILNVKDSRIELVLNQRVPHPPLDRAAVESILGRKMSVTIGFDDSRPEDAALAGGLVLARDPNSLVSRGATDLARVILANLKLDG